jgi:hypothetical protein
MGAPKGNQFWKVRAKSGRDKIFKSPENLWEAAEEYFEWVNSTPLWETKVTQYQGVPIDMHTPKMRAMTIDGLSLFLHISRSTWYEYAEHKEFSDICGKIESVIKGQKFEGAAADMLNASIIARDLGLVDKASVDVNVDSAISEMLARGRKRMNNQESEDD